MPYLKRFSLAFFGSFVVVMSYGLVLNCTSQFNVDIFLLMMLGASICCLLSGLLIAAIVRNNSLVMLMVSQVLSIATIGIIWRL